MRYSTGSQKQQWSFATPDLLRSHRCNCYDNAIASLKRQRLVLSKLHPELALTVDVEYLSIEEELLYVDFYCQSVAKTCQRFAGMPLEVKATAMTYMKRFYVSNSVMNYDPKDIWLTCIYLACKCEEWGGHNLGASKLSIDKFIDIIYAQNINQKEKVRKRTKVIEQEIPVLRGVKYHLTVHHPYLPLEGFLTELTRLAARHKLVHDRGFGKSDATRWIDTSLKTDAMFLFPPSKIALAGLVLVYQRAKHESESKVLDLLLAHLTQDTANASVECLRESVTNIVNYVEGALKQLTGAQVDLEKLGLKLKECGNPHTNRASKAYKALRKIKKSSKDEESREKVEIKSRADAERARELTGMATGNGAAADLDAPFVIRRPAAVQEAATKRRRLHLPAA